MKQQSDSLRDQWMDCLLLDRELTIFTKLNSLDKEMAGCKWKLLIKFYLQSVLQ